MKPWKFCLLLYPCKNDECKKISLSEKLYQECKFCFLDRGSYMRIIQKQESGSNKQDPIISLYHTE